MSRPSGGLSSLIPADLLSPSHSSRSSQELVSLDRVRPNPEQPRRHFEEGAMAELAASIREHGVLTPLLVRHGPGGQFVLIAGERRLRAAGLAGLTEVPVYVRDDVTEQEWLELALIENLQRADLDPIETALGYSRLVEHFGLTQDQVARRVGRERVTVTNALRLLRLPERAQQAVRSGEIQQGHAKALLGIPDDRLLLEVLERIIAESLSVRATERLVKTLGRPRGGRPVEPALRRLSDQLTRDLGTRVQVKRGQGNRGRIVIDFHSTEHLNQLLALLPQESQ